MKSLEHVHVFAVQISIHVIKLRKVVINKFWGMVTKSKHKILITYISQIVGFVTENNLVLALSTFKISTNC